MEEETIEEELNDKGLDNAYRFDKCHLIKPRIRKEEYQEIDEEVENLPFGMHIIHPFGVITPNPYAYNTRTPNS